MAIIPGKKWHNNGCKQLASSLPRKGNYCTGTVSTIIYQQCYSNAIIEKITFMVDTEQPK